MDFVQLLKDDLSKGYSKSDLERLIGLPQNCLSGVIKGEKKLSLKSKLKIQKWDKSEKPNSLQVFFVKKGKNITDLAAPTNLVDAQKPLGTKKTNIVINTTNEPKENTMAFYLKYDCYTWEELKLKKII